MRSTKRRRKLVNLPTYYKRIFPLFFAWMILLTTCVGSQSDAFQMISIEKASGQTMFSGERLVKTHDALLETARTQRNIRERERKRICIRKLAQNGRRYNKDSACHTSGTDSAVLEHLVSQGG